MAEVKLNNLLRLYRLRSKFDAVILAVHACLVERGFRCINSGEEVRLYCSRYTKSWKTRTLKLQKIFVVVIQRHFCVKLKTNVPLGLIDHSLIFNEVSNSVLRYFHRGMHTKNVISERLFLQTGMVLTMFMLFSTEGATWVLFSFLKP